MALSTQYIVAFTRHRVSGTTLLCWAALRGGLARLLPALLSLWARLPALLQKIDPAALELETGPTEGRGVEEEDVRCELLHVPAPEDWEMDIIFIHGLHGSTMKTWRQGDWHAKYQEVERIPLRRHQSSPNIHQKSGICSHCHRVKRETLRSVSMPRGNLSDTQKTACKEHKNRIISNNFLTVDPDCGENQFSFIREVNHEEVMDELNDSDDDILFFNADIKDNGATQQYKIISESNNVNGDVMVGINESMLSTNKSGISPDSTTLEGLLETEKSVSEYLNNFNSNKVYDSSFRIKDGNFTFIECVKTEDYVTEEVISRDGNEDLGKSSVKLRRRKKSKPAGNDNFVVEDNLLVDSVDSELFYDDSKYFESTLIDCDSQVVPSSDISHYCENEENNSQAGEEDDVFKAATVCDKKDNLKLSYDGTKSKTGTLGLNEGVRIENPLNINVTSNIDNTLFNNNIEENSKDSLDKCCDKNSSCCVKRKHCSEIYNTEVCDDFRDINKVRKSKKVVKYEDSPDNLIHDYIDLEDVFLKSDQHKQEIKSDQRFFNFLKRFFIFKEDELERNHLADAYNLMEEKLVPSDDNIINNNNNNSVDSKANQIFNDAKLNFINGPKLTPRQHFESEMKKQVDSYKSFESQFCCCDSNNLSSVDNKEGGGVASHIAAVREAAAEQLSSCWPRDWLPIDVPNARVISITYSTDQHLWRPLWVKPYNRTSLEARSSEMISQLTQMGAGSRPVLWVGHSKGGLFIKQMLSSAYEAWRNEGPCSASARLFLRSRACVFYSVPHRGSPLANITLPPLLRASSELQEIQYESDYVLRLHERFLEALRGSEEPPAILSYSETRRTLMGAFYLRIVSPQSADPGVGSMYGVSLDHREICKPTSRTCFLYKELLQLIEDTCPDAVFCGDRSYDNMQQVVA